MSRPDGRSSCFRGKPQKPERVHRYDAIEVKR